MKGNFFLLTLTIYKYSGKLNKKITFYGQTIPFAADVKYRGVYLDQKMNWNKLLKVQSKKMINIYTTKVGMWDWN